MIFISFIENHLGDDPNDQDDDPNQFLSQADLDLQDDLQQSSKAHPPTPPPFKRNEKSLSSPGMGLAENEDHDRAHYHQCIIYSIGILRHLQIRQLPLTQDDLFTIEDPTPTTASGTGNVSTIGSQKKESKRKDSKRCQVGKKKEIHYEIFPWFLFLANQKRDYRFRETIDEQTIDSLIEAMNYFWSRSYSNEELSHLTKIFQELDGEKKKKNIMTRIIEVYRIFRMFCDENEGQSDS